jgi:hypothetical protein
MDVSPIFVWTSLRYLQAMQYIEELKFPIIVNLTSRNRAISL